MPKMLIIIAIIVLAAGAAYGGWWYFNPPPMVGEIENPCDLDNDDDCDQTDAQILINNLGKCAGSPNFNEMADANHNGCVTLDDRQKLFPGYADGEVCIQVITPAKNLTTGECKEFPTPCDVPEGWEKVDICPASQVDTSNWKTYRNEELNIEFKYPPVLGTLNVKIFNEGFSGEFSNDPNIHFGGITKNFTAERSGYYGDFSGFKKEGDKYFFGSVDEYYEPIAPKNIISQNIITVDCMSFEDKCEPIGPSASIPKDWIAALINLKNNKFTGLIIVMKDEQENLLNQILSTFKFIK